MNNEGAKVKLSPEFVFEYVHATRTTRSYHRKRGGLFIHRLFVCLLACLLAA